MPKLVLNAEVSALCHATEDLEKVKAALLNVLPEEARPLLEKYLSVAMLEGHYGNPIFVLKLRIEQPELADALFKRVVKSLPESDLDFLEGTLKRRLDSSGHLHLRLSKPQAYMGKLRVYDGDDVIKLKVKLSPHARQELLSKRLRDLL